MKIYLILFKPFFDFFVSLLLLLMLSPLIITISLVSLSINRGNVFFVQSRPGKNGKLFKIYKFQTMTNKKDTLGNLLSDSERITGFGKFLRSTSFDELPQLFNVLKGDLSIVGPRPLLEEYLPLYNDDQKKRHLVKPGITGWAQVNGRNAISWQEKFMYDIYYINHVSFWLDLKILFLTVMKVISSQGISQNGHVTMKKFDGN